MEITPGSDQRYREVQLTDAGRAKLREIIPLWEQAQAKIITLGLGQARWNQLYSDLEEVIRLTQA